MRQLVNVTVRSTGFVTEPQPSPRATNWQHGPGTGISLRGVAPPPGSRPCRAPNGGVEHTNRAKVGLTLSDS